MRVLDAPARSRLIPVPRRLAWPSVGVVIATRNRPNLLRRALESVRLQDYPGPLRVVVVFDRTEPDWGLACSGDRPVLVMENWRTPGGAGSRNCGIIATDDCELVAFCHDDDTWSGTKLTAQVSAMRASRGALFATCAIEIEYDGRRTARLAGTSEVDIDELTGAQARLPRSSGFVVRRDALLTDSTAGGIGLIAEDAPGSRQEDWDLLLRAARLRPIMHVDAPLVRVLWGRDSVVPLDPAAQVSALRWMMARHPEFGGCRSAAASLYGEIACWEAASGNRAAAWSWARAALRRDWREKLALFAVAAAAGVVHTDWLWARIAPSP
jgi:cellulose synthase/poly-beta-1,6-N-acetylglucosamine synthase-like glycosyltransferase